MYSEHMMKLLQRAWDEVGGGNSELTRFGILNALTWLATHGRSAADIGDELTERQAGTLSRLAGVFAQQANHICPNCFRIIAG